MPTFTVLAEATGTGTGTEQRKPVERQKVAHTKTRERRSPESTPKAGAPIAHGARARAMRLKQSGSQEPAASGKSAGQRRNSKNMKDSAQPPTAFTEEHDPEELLHRLAAMRRLAPFLERRAIKDLRIQGKTQTEIARIAGTSQVHVSRVLRMIRQDPSVLEITPLIVARLYAAGEITFGDMRDHLAEREWDAGRLVEDEWVNGSLDELTLAHSEGDLTDAEFVNLIAAIQRRQEHWTRN